MSKRQDIIDLVIARMQTILSSGDYETNLGQNVEDWQTNWDDDELPALSVCDLVDGINFVNEQPTAALQQHALPLQLRIFAKSDTRPADLRKMIADVVKAIGTDQFWTNGGGAQLALWTKVTSAGIRLNEDSFEIGGAAVEIEIGYFTNSFES